MTMLSMSMHPSDETLSRLADLSEIDRMRSRAGRHVARCGRCRGEIAAIEALGEAVRALPEPVLPDALGARIAERRRSDGPTAPSHAGAGVLVDGGADTRPVRHWSTKKRTAIAAAAAVIVLAALVGPAWRRHVLAAAAPGRATMFPLYPRPGAPVGIRFVPAPDWAGGDTLWISGVIDRRFQPNGPRRRGAIPVTALLLREHDGAYRGRLVLPADALSGALTVMNAPAPGPHVRWLARLLVLTSDTSNARPSLDAMESAVYNDRGILAEQSLSDAFARWAPGHPMRWLVDVSRARRGPFDWLQFFTNGERRFARITTQLNARTDVRAGELAGMATLAYRLEEPAAAAAWTDRLVREHPGDPWTIDLRAQQIHEMELRGAPEDSIAPLIPSLDTLFVQSHGQVGDMYRVVSIVRNRGDSAMQRRWSLRAARAGTFFPSELRGRQVIFRDRDMQDSVEAFAREVLADGAGRALWNSSTYMQDPRVERALAYSYLASIALARQEYRTAVSLTDSARLSECAAMGQDTRALALLALGDTAAALPYLAAFGKNSIMLTPDSARTLLGSQFDPGRWQHAVDSVDAVRQLCRRRGR
ncbi:MAG TPA: hypothetical protein VFN39_06710 [Gemmatimonadaceae bacterium]|nr:hypothetical protein [Gemmatimonadaceae bacterium]